MFNKLLCRLVGHKPKKYHAIRMYFTGIGEVPLHEPIFCSRCGAGELDILIDGYYNWRRLYGKIKTIFIERKCVE